MNSHETSLFQRILVNELRKIPTTPRFDLYPLNGVVVRTNANARARARASVDKKGSPGRIVNFIFEETFLHFMCRVNTTQTYTDIFNTIILTYKTYGIQILFFLIRTSQKYGILGPTRNS